MNTDKVYRIVVNFQGQEISVFTTARNKKHARSCVGGRILSVEVADEETQRRWCLGTPVGAC